MQAVDRVYDTATATQMGLAEQTVCVMIHTGSRGLGHQICTDHVRQMWQAMSRYGIPLLLVRSFLALTPHVPQRTPTVVANLPWRRGTLALTDLRLGPTTVQI